VPYRSYGDPDYTPSRLRRLAEFAVDHMRAGILVVMIAICLFIIASSRM
jgi:hypothetical protein